ncbi:g patch domain-containing protein 1 [Diaporthe amygdali]|uniref:g patch domain-containing protein 1 n=1 Tax=Phomopsis amygdali TaxID=1214568 RepID=UPI0022FEA081|nr:g patch domain-containing protein 1 [Diaporthe amygdali]KAJ0110126.1 g patch domain-containing protein 1 [Diaporthe amygdali]
MSYKRTRAQYEADLQKSQSPYVAYGTPLPPLDPDVRDDGSYVPVWKQEVRDERGRKRLHGAFTGGWSAGYFNTVGSKEGWTPSAFVSSRSSRRKDDKSTTSQRPEDFMDEEDLADAQESEKLQTSHAFAGLGATDAGAGRSGGLVGLFHVQGETMGTKLLKKMGWKEGQGVGPKIRRKAELGMGTNPDSEAAGDTYLFAPENSPMIAFIRKTDRKGLGHAGESGLAPLGSLRSGQPSQSDDEDESDEGFGLGRSRFSASKSQKKKDTKARGGIGMGVLNDTGSDDEDPYEMGPRISYNRILGGSKNNKKKKDANSTPTNPALRSKPVFVPRRKAAVKAASSDVRKCHDGRPPLEGFCLGQELDPLISMINAEGKYQPPEIPAGWKSSLRPEATRDTSDYKSTADAAKASQLNPLSRGDLLGEKQLPGKSVFDFLSISARDRLAAATGKADLPEAKGEVPEGYALSAEKKRRRLLEQIPTLDKQSALGAMARGAAGGGPYGDNEDKRSRYRGYLELQAGLRSEPPIKPAKMTNDEWLQEFHEFYNVARIFRPMTGSMASRFTTSSSSNLASGTDGKAGDTGLLSKPSSKPEDTAEAAAKMGMFGHMTRSSRDFYPTRLLCKRFNVKPPAHVQADTDADTAKAQGPPGPMPTRGLIQDISVNDATSGSDDQEPTTGPPKQDIMIDSSRNEALEGKRAGEEVFKAIFGDSSDDES